MTNFPNDIYPPKMYLYLPKFLMTFFSNLLLFCNFVTSQLHFTSLFSKKIAFPPLISL